MDELKARMAAIRAAAGRLGAENETLASMLATIEGQAMECASRDEKVLEREAERAAAWLTDHFGTAAIDRAQMLEAINPSPFATLVREALERGSR